LKITKMNNELRGLDKFEAKKIILDFYADWCGPCKQLSKTLDLMAQEGIDCLSDVEVVKVNVDEFGDLVNKFEVRSMPTLVFLSRSAAGSYIKVHQKVGTFTKERFIKTLTCAYE